MSIMDTEGKQKSDLIGVPEEFQARLYFIGIIVCRFCMRNTFCLMHQAKSVQQNIYISHIILMGSLPDPPLAVLNPLCCLRMGYKRGRKQLLSSRCFSTKQPANKQINNHNGTPLTAQLYNGKTEMAAACVIALPASHNIHTTTWNTAVATTAAAAKFD